MLRSDDAPDLLRAFERRDYLLSDAGQFEQQQTRADAEAAASAAREQARTWRRSLGAGDTVPDEDAYDFDAMAMGEVWPKPDGAGRVPLPPRYWKPGRLTLAGYDIATGRRVLSSAPLEERLLSGQIDTEPDAENIEEILSQVTPEDLAELSTVERRALESWAEAHGVMLAQAGGTATMTDVPAGQSVARVGRAGVPRQPIDSRTVTQPAQALWDIHAGALKGAVAQTLGLPGDIEALVRMLTGTEDGQHMVTTEGVSDLLPDVTTDPKRKPSAAAGQFAGELVGLGGAPTKGMKAAMRGAKKLATKVAPKAASKAAAGAAGVAATSDTTKAGQ